MGSGLQDGLCIVAKCAMQTPSPQTVTEWWLSALSILPTPFCCPPPRLSASSLSSRTTALVSCYILYSALSSPWPSLVARCLAMYAEWAQPAPAQGLRTVGVQVLPAELTALYMSATQQPAVTVFLQLNC